MTCNVTSLRPRLSQIVSTLASPENGVRVIAIQEHAVPLREQLQLVRAARASAVEVVLGPTDPNSKKDAAGVAIAACGQRNLRRLAPATAAFAAFEVQGRSLQCLVDTPM
eukprot:14842664-Alexandrium_andersonii.AAC.1